MSSNPYKPLNVTSGIADRSFPWLACVGLILAILLTAVSAISVAEGYDFLSQWYGYQGNSNVPSTVWRGRFNVALLMGLYKFAFVACLFSAASCLLTRGSKTVFRAATIITIAVFAFWIFVGLKYAFYRF